MFFLLSIVLLKIHQKVIQMAKSEIMTYYMTLWHFYNKFKIYSLIKKIFLYLQIKHIGNEKTVFNI